MKLLVYPENLVLGGAALNALDLAAAAQEAGHQVSVLAAEGELQNGLAARGLRHLPVPPTSGARPTVAGVAAVRGHVRRERPDLVHTWEFASMFNAFYGARLALGVPQLATVMSMEIPRSVPRTVPVTLGTRELLRVAAQQQRAPAWLLEPPVDTRLDRPDLVDGRKFMVRLGLDPAVPTIVVVSRIDLVMKLDSVRETVRAVAEANVTRILQLVVVGDGPGRAAVAEAAAAANAAAGRRVVVLAGRLDDPRPAYAAADVVVGMGSSVIRGMSFAKPVVVVGVGGFVRLVAPETFEHFDRHGFWGVGPGVAASPQLAPLLLGLLAEEGRRRRLGAWGKRVAENRYSLRVAAARLFGFYERVLALPAGRVTAGKDATLTALRLAPPSTRRPYVLAKEILHARSAGGRPSRGSEGTGGP